MGMTDPSKIWRYVREKEVNIHGGQVCIAARNDTKYKEYSIIMHIRTATIEDYPALALIGRESQDLHHQAHPTLFQSDSEGFTVEHVRAMLASEQSTIYVAEDEGQILGYAFLRTELRTDLELFRPHVIAEITDIAVTTRMRSQGIGQQLFAVARTWAREWGAEHLELVVWEFNTRAIDFYQRQGMHTLTRTMSLSLEE